MALIIALLALTVLMGIGFAILVSSATESSINASFRRAGMAYFAARGGAEEARARMGPDAFPLDNTLASVQIPCSSLAACPKMFDRVTGIFDATRAYYIRLNNTINPLACTYLGQNCSDPNPPASSPVMFTTTQPGTPYVWVKITLATQRKLKRNLVTPCNPSDPLDPGYCDPSTLDDSQMLCLKDVRKLAIYNPADPIGSCGNPVNPAYIVTALSMQPGRANRLVREVIATGYLPGIPGPLTLDGIPSTFIPPTSNPFLLSGCDAAFSIPPCNRPVDRPSVIVPRAVDAINAQTLITDGNSCNPIGPPMGGCQPGPNYNDQYHGITNNDCPPGPPFNRCNGDPPNTASIVAATDTSVFPTNPLTSNPFFADCAGMQNLRNLISAGADHTYTPVPSTADWTTLPDAGSFNNNRTVINVINGNATIAANDFSPTPGDTGAGILLVTGNLNVTGTPSYHGIIIVLGEQPLGVGGHTDTMAISGGGNGTITGGIFIANTATCPAALGPPRFDPSGGGNFRIQYNSDWTNPPNGWFSMRLLSMN